MDTSRLKALPLFEGVSDEDLDKIAPFVSEVSVSEGKHLVDEGDYAYEFMAIEEGEAEVVRGDETLANLGAGRLLRRDRAAGGRPPQRDRDRALADAPADAGPVGHEAPGEGDPLRGREDPGDRPVARQ